MKNSIFLKTVLCFFLFAALLTSCAEEENFDIIEDVEEAIESQMLFSIANTTTTYDAAAAHCDNGEGTKIWLISNNQGILSSNTLDLNQLQLGDYVIFFLEVDGFSAYGVSTVIETVATDGTVTQELVQDDSATVNITNMDSVSASGDLSGTFTMLDGSTANYSAVFNAEVTSVSSDCN